MATGEFLPEKRNMTGEVKSANIGGLYFSATVEKTESVQIASDADTT